MSYYFPITIDSYDLEYGYFKCHAALTTDDYVTLDDMVRITTSLILPGESLAADAVIPLNDVKIGVGVYYKSTTMTDKGEYTSIVPNLSTYGLVNVYSNASDTTIFMVNMSKKIRCKLNFIDEGSGVISFDIKQVPLVRYTELMSNIYNISAIIDNANNIMTTMLTLMSNMSIDYKFYATYGKSKYFTLGNTTDLLNSLDLKLKFRIRISSIKTDTSIISDIRSFIQPLVEDVNNTSSVSSVYFSNIITKIENEFKYSQNRIIACELIKVNDYSVVYQSLINNTKELQSMTKSELLEYVPEFTKLSPSNITIELFQI